jgi:GWxTD domain-containing protein
MLILASCRSSNKNTGSQINTPVLYNPASSSLHPQIGVFHVSDAESQLFVMLNTNQLLVSEANPERIPKSEIRIHYQLFDCTEIENNKLVSDSSTFINSVEIRQQQRVIVFPIMIPAEQGRRYLLLVQTTDLLRRNTIRQFLSVNKTDIYSAQNFRLTSLNGSPKLENTINENEIFRIAYQRNPIDKLFIKYMDVSQPVATSPLAPAPVSELKFKADSVWEQTYSPNTNFMFGYEGLYLIQTDTTRQGGLLLMNFGPSFPGENRTAHLVQPIQYFTSAGEFQRLSAERHPKKVMDDFWLATTGSTDKARMLIRVFYTRMSYANRFFTDFKEGWKTDRGMIYLIYGLPNNIHKGSDSEIWEYTRRQQANPLAFVFDKKSSPYSDEYYVLRRGDAQPTFWRQATDSWRKGRVFSINDLE